MYAPQLSNATTTVTTSATTTTNRMMDVDNSKVLDNNRTDFSAYTSPEGLLSLPELQLSHINPVAVQMLHGGAQSHSIHHQPSSLTGNNSGGGGMSLKRKRQQWEGAEGGGSTTNNNNNNSNSNSSTSSAGGTNANSSNSAKIEQLDRSSTGPASVQPQQADAPMREEKRAKVYYDPSSMQGMPMGPMMNQRHASPSSSPQKQLQQGGAHLQHLQQSGQPHYMQTFAAPPSQMGQPAMTQPSMVYGPSINADVYRASQEAYISVVKKPMQHYAPVPQRSQHPVPPAHQVHHIQIQRVHQQMQHHQLHPQHAHHLDKGSYNVPPSITNLGDDIPDSPAMPQSGGKGDSAKKISKKGKEKKSPKVNSGERVDITHLLKYPQSQAAQLLNMSQATFSKRFREANNKRWPYRRLIVLEKQLKTAISEGDRAAAEALETAMKQLLTGCFIYKK